MSAKTKLWKALSKAAGVKTSAIIEKIKSNEVYKKEQKELKKSGTGRDKEFAPGNINYASDVIYDQTQKLNKKITSAIEKQFGPEMAKTIKKVLVKPENYTMDKDLVGAIKNMQHIKGIEPAANKAIDEIYKITGTKKPEEGVDVDYKALKDTLTIALFAKFGKGTKAGKEYKTLLDNAIQSKTEAASIRTNVTSVFNDPETTALPTKEVKARVEQIASAAELKQGLSAANKEYWKMRNPEQAKIREAIGNGAASALNAFKKAIIGSGKNAKQANGPSAGHSTAKKPEGPSIG